MSAPSSTAPGSTFRPPASSTPQLETTTASPVSMDGSENLADALDSVYVPAENAPEASSPLRDEVEDQLARFERDRAPHLPALDDLDIDINDTLRPVTPVPPSEQNYAVYETAQIFDPLPPEKVDF